MRTTFIIPLMLLAGCASLGPTVVREVPVSLPPIELARCIEQKTDQNRYSDHITQFRTIGDTVELVAKGGFPDPVLEVWRITLSPGKPATVQSYENSPSYTRLKAAIASCHA